MPFGPSHPPSPSALAVQSGKKIRYVVRHSDDVIEQHSRITVSNERDGQVVWHKTTALTEEEIVDTLTQQGEAGPQWTIHRPRTGWYLRLRSPFFPPGTYVPLVPGAGARSTTFRCEVRTNLDVSAQLDAVLHSYPPKANTALQAGSSSTSTVSDGSNPTQPATVADKPEPPKPQVMTFFVGRHPDTVHQQHALSNLVDKALRPSHHNFTIYTASLPTLLSFRDTTSALAIQTTGTIELDEGMAQMVGVDPAFWVAATLAYLDFLNAKDAYLAAMES